MSQDTAETSQPSILSIKSAIESKSKCWVIGIVHKESDIIRSPNSSQKEYLIVDESGR